MTGPQLCIRIAQSTRVEPYALWCERCARAWLCTIEPSNERTRIWIEPCDAHPFGGSMIPSFYFYDNSLDLFSVFPVEIIKREIVTRIEHVFNMEDLL